MADKKIEKEEKKDEEEAPPEPVANELSIIVIKLSKNVSMSDKELDLFKACFYAGKNIPKKDSPKIEKYLNALKEAGFLTSQSLAFKCSGSHGTMAKSISMMRKISKVMKLEYMNLKNLVGIKLVSLKISTRRPYKYVSTLYLEFDV